jgi:hypothetical protein
MNRLFSVLVVLFLVAPSVAPATAAEDEGESIRLSARVVDTMGTVAGKSSARVKMQIDAWSTDEDIIHLVQVLVQGGNKALYEELRTLEKKGYLSVDNELAHNVVVARSLATESGKGRVVRLLLNRPITFFEAVNKLRLEDYPFGFVEVTLDENGEGEGDLYAAARITVTEEGLDIVSYGVKPLKLMKVKIQ